MLETSKSLTSHVTNFVSNEGVLRFVTKRTKYCNFSLGNEVIWKWERPRAYVQSHRREVADATARTQLSKKNYSISFELFVRLLLYQRREKLQYFG